MSSIARIKINNIMGIEELEFAPGGFNTIRGKNGASKSSILESIKAALGSGHDATLLRAGAEKGEIVLVLDDQTEIRRRVSEKSSTTDIVQNGKKLGRPAENLKSWIDTLSVNPVEFLTARKQDRVKVLLETMPIKIDPARLTAISGIRCSEADGELGLAIIDSIRTQVFNDRTGTNRAVKEKEATINQMRQAMPEPVGGIEGSEEDLRSQLAQADAERDTELKRIEDKLGGIKKDNQTKIDAIRAEAQAAIDKIKADAVAQVEAITKTEREIEIKAGGQREITIKRHTDKVGPINTALASIVNNRENHARREQALAMVEQMEAELEELVKDATRQTDSISNIDAYKLELLNALPIAGIEVKDGEIYRDGVQFDRLNTSQRVGIAVDIAKLRAGSLGIVCLDGLELMDSEHFEELRRQTEEAGLQVFVTRVTDEELTVDTE